jgi:iron(III) transport system substrate-binding protein
VTRGKGFLLAIVLVHACAGCGGGAPGGAPREVVLYTSVDEEVARPLIARFEARTAGVRVLPVFDVEATKTTGLVSRILAERAAPRADVFWSSESLRTEQLKREGALAAYRPEPARDIPDEWKDPEGFYVGFAARARVLAWNTRRLPPGEAPRRLEDLLAPRFRGEVAIANPLFGTTGAEAAALFAARGDGPARELYERLLASGARVVDGNSVVRDLVASGAVIAGTMDTDDVFTALDDGKPLAFCYTGLVIPNTVALVRGGPHGEAGRALVDFLASEEAERLLAGPPARQMPLRTALAGAAKPPACAVGDVPRLAVAPSACFDALARSQEFFRGALGR